jgi:hypothetical protein
MISHPPQQAIAGGHSLVALDWSIRHDLLFPEIPSAGINTNGVPSTTAWAVSLRKKSSVSKEDVCESSRRKAVETAIAKVEQLFGDQVAQALGTFSVILCYSYDGPRCPLWAQRCSRDGLRILLMQVELNPKMSATIASFRAHVPKPKPEDIAQLVQILKGYARPPMQTQRRPEMVLQLDPRATVPSLPTVPRSNQASPPGSSLRQRLGQGREGRRQGSGIAGRESGGR